MPRFPSSSRQGSRHAHRPWARAIAAAFVAVLGLFVGVVLARWMLSLERVASFVERYPGTGGFAAAAPTGVPAWLGWQHFLNGFLLLLIVRTGWLVRVTHRPNTYWRRNNTGLIRTQVAPTKISFDLWLHLTLDALWLINGAIFIILLILTGQWMRLVPTSLEVVPNSISVALQYLSLDWPTEDSWAHYNALQGLTYFVTVFVAAPLAGISGYRMSPAWSKRWTRASRLVPISLARRIHRIVLVYFVAFAVAHITLVLATGALRNLNQALPS